MPCYILSILFYYPAILATTSINACFTRIIMTRFNNNLVFRSRWRIFLQQTKTWKVALSVHNSYDYLLQNRISQIISLTFHTTLKITVTVTRHASLYRTYDRICERIFANNEHIAYFPAYFVLLS